MIETTLDDSYYLKPQQTPDPNTTEISPVVVAEEPAVLSSAKVDPKGKRKPKVSSVMDTVNIAKQLLQPDVVKNDGAAKIENVVEAQSVIMEEPVGKVAEETVENVVIPFAYGDIVRGIDQTALMVGKIDYRVAVVLSSDPLILSSTDGSMRWQRTLTRHKFVKVGEADQDTLNNCKRRLSPTPHQYLNLIKLEQDD